MLSEMRKYRLGFTVAHQYLHQFTPDIRHAILGNAGTVISFHVGAEDAPYPGHEFRGVFEEGRSRPTSKPPYLSKAYDRWRAAARRSAFPPERAHRGISPRLEKRAST